MGRPATVRRAALAATAAVVLATAGAFAWSDDLPASTVRPLWDRSTADARILLVLEGPLVFVVGALAAVVVVALVAWRRERARPDGPGSRSQVEPGAPRPSARQVLQGWLASGRLGLLFAALAASGAAFSTYAAVESIWGDPSLRLSLLTLGGAGVVAAAAMGPSLVIGSSPADGERRGLRHGCTVLLATLALYGVVVSLVDTSGSLSIEGARRRLGGGHSPGAPSAEVEDYYARLFGPSLGADDLAITGNAELGLVVVVARATGYDAGDLAQLVRQARQLGLPDTAVLVHRGLAIIVLGDVGGLDALNGDDVRDRVRDLLDA